MAGNMSREERYVQKVFEEYYSLSLRKIRKGEEPTPDFEV